MDMVRELSLQELIFTALCMLLDKKERLWSYYEENAEWWELRLRTRKN